MKYILILGLFALASFANGTVCPECDFERREASKSAVTMLKNALRSMAASKEGPFVKIVHVNCDCVEFVSYKMYPIINVDLVDNIGKQQRCDVTLYFSINEFLPAKEIEIKFDCEYLKLTKVVNLQEVHVEDMGEAKKFLISLNLYSLAQQQYKVNATLS